MKIIRTLLLIVFCTLLFGACCRKVIAPTAVQKIVIKDSIVEVVRDSIVTIPSDSAWLKALVACDSVGNVYLKELLGYHAGESIKPPKVVIRDNIITALSVADSFNVYLALKDRYHYSLQDSNKVVTEVIEVNKLTKMQGFWIVLGRLLACVLLLFLGFSIFKIYKTIRI